MSKRLFGAVLLSAAVVFSSVSFADAPCKDKREAKHQAHKAIAECLKGWAHDGKPGATDPSDDCTAKTSAFVNAAKDLKACRAEHGKDKAAAANK